jgi:hypothetical protein
MKTEFGFLIETLEAAERTLADVKRQLSLIDKKISQAPKLREYIANRPGINDSISNYKTAFENAQKDWSNVTGWLAQINIMLDQALAGTKR